MSLSRLEYEAQSSQTLRLHCEHNLKLTSLFPIDKLRTQTRQEVSRFGGPEQVLLLLVPTEVFLRSKK